MAPNDPRAFPSRRPLFGRGLYRSRHHHPYLDSKGCVFGHLGSCPRSCASYGYIRVFLAYSPELHRYSHMQSADIAVALSGVCTTCKIAHHFRARSIRLLLDEPNADESDIVKRLEAASARREEPDVVPHCSAKYSICSGSNTALS